MSNNSAFFAGAASFDQYPNRYLTIADETIAGGSQAIYEDYLELAASFVYELAADAILVIGDFAAPLPALDEYANLNVTVADEVVPANGEVVFADYLELTAPFASELAPNALMQLGTEVAPRGGLIKLFSTTLIATGALDTGAAGIPPGYGHLYIVIIARSAAAATTEGFTLRFNGDSGANYDDAFQQGSSAGSSGSASGGTSLSAAGLWTGNTETAGYAATVIVEVPFYDNPNWFKTFLVSFQTGGSGAATLRQAEIAGGWRSLAPINQITLDSTSHLLASSSMTVYATG